MPNNAPSRPASRWTPLILIAGDVLVLLLFIFFGQREHELTDPADPLLGLLITGGEFAVPWLIAGALLGAFPRELPGLGPLLGRSLNAWLVAAPLGVLLRAALLRRAVIPTTFLVVALGLGGAFLLGWRLIVGLIWQASYKRTGSGRAGNGWGAG